MSALIDDQPSPIPARLEDRVGAFDGAALAPPPTFMQRVARLDVLAGLAFGSAIAAQWLIGAPVGAGLRGPA